MEMSYRQMINRVKCSALLWADEFCIYATWILMIYLTDVWKMNLTKAVAVVNFFGGIIRIMPVIMQFIVDQFVVGSFWMLLVSNFAYSAGFALLSFSTPPVFSWATAGSCSAFEPECIGDTQKILFYTSLFLIAVGRAGHLTSLEPFRTSQLKHHSSDSDELEVGLVEKQPKHSGHHVDYIIYKVVVLFLVPTVAVCALDYIESWSIRFAIPAIFTILATVIFLSDSGSCKPDEVVEGNPFTWDLKMIGTLIYISTISLEMGAISSLGYTFFIEQASHMNCEIWGFEIVPILILTWFYDLVKRPFEEVSSLKYFYQLATPFATIFGILCCIVAALVETRRLGVVETYNLVDKPDETVPMTIFWLLPQFLLLGITDGLSDKRSIVSLFYSRPNESTEAAETYKKRYMELFAQASVGVGIITSVLVVNVVSEISASWGGTSWFQDTLNTSQVDNYYWFLSAACLAIPILAILMSCVIGCCCSCCCVCCLPCIMACFRAS